MNPNLLGALEAVAGIALGALFAWWFARDAKHDAKDLRRRLVVADEQNKAWQQKQSDSLREERQRQHPVRISPEEPGHQPNVARPEVLAELFGRLFTGNSRLLVVGGDFGMGKTWTAREFAKIAGAYRSGAGYVAPFRDGVLYASLGENPASRAELKKWHDAVRPGNGALADGKPGAPVEPPSEMKIPGEDLQIAREIAAHLGVRRPLVIIDDICNIDDAESLLLATPDSPVLLNTPRPEVFKAFTDRGATGVNLPGLTTKQARQLLGAFVEPTLRAPATETALPKRDAFLGELSRHVDTDPFTVAQTGAFVRDKLSSVRDSDGSRPSWATVSQQALAEIVRDIIEQPEAIPGEVADDADGIQPEHTAGTDIFQARLRSLSDHPLQLAILQTLSLLQPRPEQFTAAEIAAMIIPALGQESDGDRDQQSRAAEPAPDCGVQAALDDLADRYYLERTETLVLDRDAFPSDGSSTTRPEFRYSVHNRARQTLARTINPDTRKAFHERAVDYWRSWIDPRHPASHLQGASPYQIATNHDGLNWLRAARNVIYHLRHLDDRVQARQTFAAIYFELFYWWGVYLRYEVIEEFVLDLRAQSRGLQDPADAEWSAAVMAFHHGYLPGHETVYREGDPDWRPAMPDYQRSQYDWPTVTAALETILRTSELGISPEQLLQHDQWHTRALIDIFLADSLRYRPPAEACRLWGEIDRCHGEARELIQRCNDYDEAHGRTQACAWILPWISWQEAEEARRRSATAGDAAVRDVQWRIASDSAASAIRGALAGDSTAELIDDRDDLDYELLAQASLIQGDLTLAKGGILPAATWYADAVVLARALQYRPRTDDYTRVFSGEVSEHVRRTLTAARREAATGSPAELAAATAAATVERNGYVCHWGAGSRAESTDPTLLADPVRFMKAVMGPPLPAGKHDDADPIPTALARAADRVIEEIWDAVHQTPAHQPAAQQVA